MSQDYCESENDCSNINVTMNIHRYFQSQGSVAPNATQLLFAMALIYCYYYYHIYKIYRVETAYLPEAVGAGILRSSSLN